MAWTSSAGPEGTFALAGGAAERGGEPSQTTGSGLTAGLTGKPFAMATLAHLCGFAVVAPFADSNPLVAIPAVIGVTVTYLTLARPGTTNRATSQYDPATQISEHQSATADGTTQPAPASPHQRTVNALCPSLTPSEVSGELRAELMARVSHELRTPLNAVMGFSDLMGHQMFGPLGHPRYEEYVSHIRESSQRLLKTAEDTLAMTSLMAKASDRSDREPLDLSALVREAAAALRADTRRNDISCTFDIEAGIEVIAHRRALRQALVNVMSEAMAKAEDGARVVVTASTDHDRVALIVTADRILPAEPEEHRSLPICLARTLLELDGCHLFENIDPSMPWSVLLSIDAAAQTDFFSKTCTI